MITQKEYQKRRKDLALCLPGECLAVVPSARDSLRNGDSHYRFRQDSDFYYLTGFNEPDCLLLITSGARSESILFNRPREPTAEQWTGRRLGQEDAPRALGVDAAFSFELLGDRLPELLAGKKTVFFSFGRHPVLENRLMNAWTVVVGQARRGVEGPSGFTDLAPILGEMRLMKSEAELALMRRAVEISVAAHQRAMRATPKASFEYQLEAELMYEFFRGGCRSVAYDPIVASGSNACVLHYTDNNQSLNSGDLVLVDAGGEFENYAADITRTFPVNGRFSAEQRVIYELVLSAQKAGIALVKPGCLWDEVQKTIVQKITAGLVEIGVLKGSVAELVEEEAYKPFYTHTSGHWLGLDVHDSGSYQVMGKWRPLKPGMTLTVEPGIYISPSQPGVDPRWLGIGVRIEDDIVVTENGSETLSSGLAVEVDEIEAILRD